MYKWWLALVLLSINTTLAKDYKRPAPAPAPHAIRETSRHLDSSHIRSRASSQYQYEGVVYSSFEEFKLTPAYQRFVRENESAAARFDAILAEKRATRAAAVEAGRIRHQYPASTNVWVDEHNTHTARARLAMGEPRWLRLHQPQFYDFDSPIHTAVKAVADHLQISQQEAWSDHPGEILEVLDKTHYAAPSPQRVIQY